MTTTFCNLRDVGGLPLVGGGSVPRGVLYRGDAPVAGDEHPDLAPWPPGSVIDLRGPDERGAMGTVDFWPASIPVLEVDLMPEADPASWEDGRPIDAEVLKPMYRGIAERSDLLVPVATAAATLPTPVFVHCAGGKDRTAVATALLLEVAGVETAAMVGDQLRSNEVLGDLRVRFERAMGRKIEFEVPSTVEEALLAALEVWRSHPGGVRGWLVAGGMDPALVEQLRTRLRS